jgi:catechol 2,3-dioxygenase-like lactoylglutathione lyase family enzyme
MVRPIDHLVIAVHDLDAAQKSYGRLGFTLTPVARHPFGTANSLVQLDSGYLELLGIADPVAIPPAGEGAFSFGAFNRDFLRKREGISMLALQSADPAADRADFEARELPLYAPFRFERTARGPDGAERPLAFSLTFTSDARMPDAGFFTCHHERPENFWRAEYQRHANGALRIDAVVMVARDPADFHEFFFYFTGQHDMRADSLGVTLDTGGGKIEILSPVAVKGLFGEVVEAEPRPRFVAMRIAVVDLERMRAVLAANGVGFRSLLGRLVVPASEACGVAVAFSEAGGT